MVRVEGHPPKTALGEAFTVSISGNLLASHPLPLTILDRLNRQGTYKPFP
jgi:hypothetical protein